MFYKLCLVLLSFLAWVEERRCPSGMRQARSLSRLRAPLSSTLCHDLLAFDPWTSDEAVLLIATTMAIMCLISERTSGFLTLSRGLQYGGGCGEGDFSIMNDTLDWRRMASCSFV